MGATVEELKKKYKDAAPAAPAAEAKEPTATKDRGIKGTLVDDYAIEIAMKVLTLLSILVIGSIGYLWLEKVTTIPAIVCPAASTASQCVAKAAFITLTPVRIWFPVVGWGLLAFTHQPFLRFGWWGLLATLTVLPTVSGYLWQFFQLLVGTR